MHRGYPTAERAPMPLCADEDQYGAEEEEPEAAESDGEEVLPAPHDWEQWQRATRKAITKHAITTRGRTGPRTPPASHTPTAHAEPTGAHNPATPTPDSPMGS